jgi:hypothetical protein
MQVKVKSKSELLFRRAFIPWYNAEPVLVVLLILAVAVLLFSTAGIAAALDTPRYYAYIWVPCLLGILSLALTVSTLIRLVRRGSPGSGPA